MVDRRKGRAIIAIRTVRLVGDGLCCDSTFKEKNKGKELYINEYDLGSL